MKRDDRDAELRLIAHDLSNLLAAIRTFATMIGDKQRDDPATRADVEQIFEAVDAGVAAAKRLRALAAPVDELLGER